MHRCEERTLLHLGDGLRRAVDPADIYFLEAVRDETRVRLRASKALMDVRSLGVIFPLFEPYGFLRIHHEYAVNFRKIREVRRRQRGRDWEVKLQPPVNRVLPVSRSALPALWQAFLE